MPIIVPNSLENDPLFKHLEQEGAILLPEEVAAHQDIRPARIGILNLMPATAMEATESQWLRYMSNTVLQIDPVLIKFDEDFREREGASRAPILERYTCFSEAAEEGLDGLIVTGDNLEIDTDGDQRRLFDFSKVKHAEPLNEVIDWARDNVHSTIYSCWGAHYALDYLYDLKRELVSQKIFGVFDHKVSRQNNSEFTDGMDDVIRAPHSRWGNIRPEDIEGPLKILAVSNKVGWLLLQSENNAGGQDLFIQGHPEYGRYDLHNEYVRDRQEGQAMPQDYYRGDSSQESPNLSWVNDAKALHANWIRSIYKNFA